MTAAYPFIRNRSGGETMAGGLCSSSLP